MRARGLHVAVLGVDGAGKSALIDALLPVLAARGFVVHRRHLRPGLLPPLARLRGRAAPTEAAAVVDPHGSSPSGTVGSLLRLGYLTLDYLLGQALVIRRELTRQRAVSIFDRYAYDIALDPRRFRIALPASVVRCATRLIPAPDLIICLYGDPAVVARRKGELPVSEVQRQVEALRSFARRRSQAVLLSTTEQDLQAVRDRALAEIVRCARQRGWSG